MKLPFFLTIYPDLWKNMHFHPIKFIIAMKLGSLLYNAQKLLKTNETTPEKNSSVNETELKNVSFAEIIPLPSCYHENVVKRQNKANKQHPIVFTSTPLKEELEKKEDKKNKKTTIKSDKAKRNVFVTQEGSTLRQKSKRTKIALNYKICEEGESEIEDDDDVRDKNITEDICILCGEFGKNSELWLRCVYCGHWAHKACSNSPKDKKFICDFCL
ncbi:uncharacterized protein LOC126878803 [Diabrotica virgifera virgifera]|uniref:Zinc finger PHD-type domain-containing protein n=1 Tax=Diabrotica virgifera virgifera TaxID=50390 RepID=A0ABM5JI95_DIAVI|nr:uncharacterized protein LOC126878803 [Diabrotica virgifera virgifera]